MKKLIVALALTVPLFANPALFTKYEATRQGFLKTSLPDVQKGARALSTAATAAKMPKIAELATAVAKSPDMAKARESFSSLSDEMIKLRATARGAKPAVYSCPMVKKSWLQAKGTIGNPYDKAMETCGTLTAE